MNTRSPDSLARQMFFIVAAGVVAFITAVTAVLIFSSGAN